MALSKYQDAAQMEANIDNAAPRILANGNWERWDSAVNGWVDTGKKARGEVGPKGNMQFAAFEVDASLELLMHTTEEYDGADFRLNENGELEVII